MASGCTSLVLAVMFNGDSSVVSELLDAKADYSLKAKGYACTAVHTACIANHHEALAVLLDAGAADIETMDPHSRLRILRQIILVASNLDFQKNRRR